MKFYTMYNLIIVMCMIEDYEDFINFILYHYMNRN